MSNEDDASLPEEIIVSKMEWERLQEGIDIVIGLLKDGEGNPRFDSATIDYCKYQLLDDMQETKQRYEDIEWRNKEGDYAGAQVVKREQEDEEQSTEEEQSTGEGGKYTVEEIQLIGAWRPREDNKYIKKEVANKK